MRHSLLWLTTLLLSVSCGSSRPDKIFISSLEEMVRYAAEDNVEVFMKEGVYVYSDSDLAKKMTLDRIRNGSSQEYEVAALVDFSGNGSIWHLDGVEIGIDTAMHKAFPDRHLFEFFVSGNNNVIEGLYARDMGDTAPVSSAIMIHVAGDGNVLKGLRLFVKGSYPYGYGHLLGKSYPALVNHHKHSSLLVTGRNITLDGCHVETQAFGHGIVLQGAENTIIRNCYVKGQMRTTDEMLAETSGPAYEIGFRSDYPPGVILPGQVKALSEDGLRAYPDGYNGRKTKNLTVENTVVENMRSGFDFSAMCGKVEIRGCTAKGCQEKGYSLPDGGVITASNGDSTYGPLLTFVTKDICDCTVELELLPSICKSCFSERMAEIQGHGHRIVLRQSDSVLNFQGQSIVVGASFWADVHKWRNPDIDISKWSGAFDIHLENHTAVPVTLTKYASDCNIVSDAPVSDIGYMSRNLGKGLDQTLVVYGTSVESNKNGRLWVDRLSKRLDDTFPGRLEYYNSGMSGQNSRWALKNLKDSVLARNPDAVILEFSTNDAVERFGISTDECKENTERMISEIKRHNPDCQVILLTVCGYPLGKGAVSRKYMDEYNDVYRKIAKEKGLLMIDIASFMSRIGTEFGVDSVRYYQYDGIHTTYEGGMELFCPKVYKELTGG